jgi:hypothetical protein
MALDHANYFIAQQHSSGEYWGGAVPENNTRVANTGVAPSQNFLPQLLSLPDSSRITVPLVSFFSWESE